MSIFHTGKTTDLLLEHAIKVELNTILTEGFGGRISAFFKKIIQYIKDFFARIFKKNKEKSAPSSTKDHAKEKAEAEQKEREEAQREKEELEKMSEEIRKEHVQKRIPELEKEIDDLQKSLPRKAILKVTKFDTAEALDIVKSYSNQMLDGFISNCKHLQRIESDTFDHFKEDLEDWEHDVKEIDHGVRKMLDNPALDKSYGHIVNMTNGSFPNYADVINEIHNSLNIDKFTKDAENHMLQMVQKMNSEIKHVTNPSPKITETATTYLLNGVSRATMVTTGWVEAISFSGAHAQVQLSDDYKKVLKTCTKIEQLQERLKNMRKQ